MSTFKTVSLKSPCSFQHADTRFDVLRTRLAQADRLFSVRNEKVGDFADELCRLEMDRTAAIKDCYSQHMLCLRRISDIAFQRLYDKYLKVNAVSLYRTRVDVRTAKRV